MRALARRLSNREGEGPEVPRRDAPSQRPSSTERPGSSLRSRARSAARDRRPRSTRASRRSGSSRAPAGSRSGTDPPARRRGSGGRSGRPAGAMRRSSLTDTDRTISPAGTSSGATAAWISDPRRSQSGSPSARRRRARTVGTVPSTVCRTKPRSLSSPSPSRFSAAARSARGSGGDLHLDLERHLPALGRPALERVQRTDGRLHLDRSEGEVRRRLVPRGEVGAAADQDPRLARNGVRAPSFSRVRGEIDGQRGRAPYSEGSAHRAAPGPPKRRAPLRPRRRSGSLARKRRPSAPPALEHGGATDGRARAWLPAGDPGGASDRLGGTRT